MYQKLLKQKHCNHPRVIKTIKNKNHKQHKLGMLKVSLPQNDAPPSELLLFHISPFLIRMAKGLLLCSEAVKLG